jgi:hypothetical protein
MRLTIIPSDNAVIIDGRGMSFSLSGYPSLKGIHAVQWDGEKGHIEFKNSPFSTTDFRTNERINGIAAYRDIIDRWMQLATEEDAKPPPAPLDPRTTPEYIEHARRTKEIIDAQRHTQASPNHGGSGTRPGIRKEDGYTTVRGEGVQPSGQKDRDPSKEEAEGLKRRI